ncbi:unnamed protein product [Pipistrellus nathusii]|uniref:Histone H2A n=1 Tax=Pipistrellus nathusii TaxID=59473 RepID=A0ABP0AM58_PIPNA
MSGQSRREGPSDHQRRRRTRSRTARADLVFSVSHLERRLLDGHYSQRLSANAPVYLAAIIQYLTATVLELAADEAHKMGCRRITPQLLDMAIHNNALLSGFFDNITISVMSPGMQ